LGGRLVQPSDMRHKGRISHWNPERGFGFVTPALDGERVLGQLT
jgi:hypothetical protein